MDTLLNIQIGELARDNFRNIQTFQRFNLDFFCKGSQTLKEAILEVKADSQAVLDALTANELHSGLEVNVESWPLDLLADYIQKTHHRYTDTTLFEIRNLIKQYIVSEGKEIETIKKLQGPFEALAGELGAHMKREELILFPQVRKIVATRGTLENPAGKSVENPVNKMIHEHDTQFEILMQIRELLMGYQMSENHSEEYIEIVQLIQNLDADLGVHIHLENNILFPKSVALEKSKTED